MQVLTSSDPCVLLAMYIKNRASQAKGSSFSLKISKINRWISRSRQLRRSEVMAIRDVLIAMAEKGLVEQIGPAYVVRRGTALWDLAMKLQPEELCRAIKSMP